MSVTKQEKRLMARLEDSKLPVMLPTLMKVMELTEDVEASTDKLSEVILKDQALTAAILRRVNSAYYSFAQEITTVKHAVVLLGFRTVKSMALGISLHELFGAKPEESLQIMAYWRHSLATGVAAEILTEIMDGSTREEVFIAGLLHDIGKMVMYTFMDEPYADVVELVKNRKGVLDAEQEVFGTNHVRVGQLVGEYWGLPRIYRSVIETHHDRTLPEVDEEQIELCNVVYVANQLSGFFDEPTAGMIIDIDRLTKEASIRLKMSEDQLESVLEQLPARITEVARVLDIDVAKPEEIISILSRANIEIGRLCRVNERANADLRVRVHRLSVLHKMSQMFAAQHSADKIFDVAVQIVSLTFAVEKVSILYRKPGSQHLTIQAGIGIPKALIETHARTPGDSISAWVAEKASPLLIKDLNNDKRFRLSEFAHNYYTNSLISVPIVCDRKVVGVLNINNKKSRKPLDEHDLTFAETVTNQVGVALHSSELFEKLQEKYMMQRME
ncbi:HDOD domain-containing protein, partial [Candidatus Hydrogenedentota bacterium]